MTDFMDGAVSVSDMLQNMTDELREDMLGLYPDVRFGSNDKLRMIMNKVYAKTGRQFVIVIDEWDAVFRTWKEDENGQKEYLDFLRDILKDKPYVALAYMTGILPIKKYGRHSALNMFDEYSMTVPLSLAPYMGFTEDEVSKLCRRYGRNFDAIKEWYDGYTIGASRYSLYSPLSVVKAVSSGLIMNYWNKTETYEALAEYIRMDYDGLKDAVALLMDGGRVQIDTSTYQNDMTTFHGRDDILSLLIHLGYLGYDDTTREVFIPNREILDEFKTSTKSDEWADTFEAFRLSQKLSITGA